MPLPFQSPKPINENDLKDYLRIIIEKLLENKPAAKDPAAVKEMVNEAIKLINESFIDAPEKININTLRDPNFIKQLAVSLLVTAEIKNNPQMVSALDKSLNKLISNPKFVNEFKALSDPKNPKSLNKQDALKDLLDKFLGKDQHEALKKTILDFRDKIFSNLGIKNKNAPKQPGNKEDEGLINLYGLVAPGIAGSHQAYVPQFHGNAANIPDPHAGEGNAQIDKIHSIKQSVFGDSLNLTKGNIEKNKELPKELTEKLITAEKHMDDVGLKPGAPRLTAGG